MSRSCHGILSLNLRRLAKVLAAAIALSLGTGEARWIGGGGGDRATAKDPKSSLSGLNPEQLEESARKAATNIVVWGTSTLYQLKESAQMRKSVARSRASRGLGPGTEKDGIKVDAILGKQIVEGALGGVLIMMNSPALGRMGDAIKRIMTDQRRQFLILQLHSQLTEAHGPQLGSGGPSKDPVGFWEGALRNKELADAHDRFMSDVEALANSGLAKRVGASAEAYHEAMLKYASSEAFEAPPKS